MVDRSIWTEAILERTGWVTTPATIGADVGHLNLHQNIRHTARVGGGPELGYLFGVAEQICSVSCRKPI